MADFLNHDTRPALRASRHPPDASRKYWQWFDATVLILV